MYRTPAAFALIFVYAIAFPYSTTAQERVDHPSAGISVNRPAGWHDATLSDVQANRERVRLSDPELEHALRTRSTLPLFAFTRYAEPHAGLNPSVQVTLRPALAGAPTQLLAGAAETLRRAFDDFRIVTPIHAVQVDGWPAAHMRATYTLTNRRGERFPVLSRLWLVPRGRVMFLIGMSGGQAGDELCEAEFDSVFSSIAIQK